MGKGKLAAGAMIFALIGFAAEAGTAQGLYAGGERNVDIDIQKDVDIDVNGVDVDIQKDVDIDIQVQGKGGWPGGGYGQCLPPKNPPKGGQCYNPPPPVCPQSDCPDGQCSPPIKPGECWSQCIIQGKFRTVSKPVKTCQPCGTPIVSKKGIITESKPVVVRTPSHGYKVKCVPEQVGVTYVMVQPPEYKNLTVPDCKKEEVLWPTYKPERHYADFPYTKPVGLPGQMETAWITVPSQSPWEHLYRKATPCPGNSSGMTDCSAVCSEIKPGKKQRIRISRCKDKDCRFTNRNMPPIRVPYTTEVGIPPELSGTCPTKTIRVMTKPPVWGPRPVMAKVCKPEKFHVPGKMGTVTASVPQYGTQCKPNAPVYDCIPYKEQVCKPVLVWRQEAICQDDIKSHSSLIGQVQTALIQAGYEAGPADGNLHEQTKQAVWKFQEDKGLAVGGTLTKETLEALGIYQ